MDPPPEYLQHRIQMFERLKAEYDAFVKGRVDRHVQARRILTVC